MQKNITQKLKLVPTWKKWLKACNAFVAVAAIFGVGLAFAADTKNIGDVATEVTKSFEGIARLITAIAYVAGIAFSLGAIIKFKAHKDNPTQVPIGAPISLLFVGAALMFLPTLFGIAGQTIFGSTTGMGGITGTTSF